MAPPNLLLQPCNSRVQLAFLTLNTTETSKTYSRGVLSSTGGVISINRHSVYSVNVLWHQSDVVSVLVRSLQTSDSVTAVSTLQNVAQTHAGVRELAAIQNWMAGLHHVQTTD